MGKSGKSYSVTKIVKNERPSIKDGLSFFRGVKTMINELRTCIEQKQVLLTKILNLSRQIKNQCNQPEQMNPSFLIEQRQIYLNRLKKCVDRIGLLVGKLPPQEQNRINTILSAPSPKPICTPEESELWDLEVKSRSLLQEICSCDEESKKKMKEECERLRKLVNDSRSKRNNNSLYF
ncbi:MAG: hypothetical protein ACFWUC_01400 [Oscillospiraceae bacterium]|jgi:hypothetical protein